jgi:DNA adenine methylase
MRKLSFIKIYGGKYQHAKWIISHFPVGYEKLTYISPTLGGGNIELQMRQADREFLSDLHYPTYCMYVALQNGDLLNAVRYLKYNRITFEHFKDFKPVTLLDYAVREYVLHRMSRGGMKKDFAWSDRLRGGQPGDVNAWMNALSNLPNIQRRLQNSIILNEDCVSLIKRYRHAEEVFFYIDPPYLLETRTSKSVYDIEFDEAKHVELLDALQGSDAKWLLSGYESKLYNDRLGPPIAKKEATLSSSQAKKKNTKVECLWSNYA